MTKDIIVHRFIIRNKQNPRESHTCYITKSNFRALLKRIFRCLEKKLPSNRQRGVSAHACWGGWGGAVNIVIDWGESKYIKY